MDIYLKVLQGPRQGDLFKVQKGATIGRSRADINLKDPKASSIHATIEVDMGIFYFVDNGSSNGTLVGGLREDRIELKPGTQLVIGSTILEVQNEFQAKSKDSTTSLWREDLYSTLQNIVAPQNPQPIHRFESLLKIYVRQGIQEGSSWTIGYGPRKFGANCLGGTLLEPGAPDTCFEIFKKDNIPFIETSHKELVLINNQKKDSEKIYDGLEVRILNTLLEIQIVKPE
jgi:hypothetical protein